MKLAPFRKLIIVMLVIVSAFSVVHAQSSPTLLTFNGDSITVTGAGATATGNTVLITAAGTYTLSGTLNDGQVVVDDENKGAITLIFDGVSLTSSTSAPIYIKEAGSVEIVLADGSQNMLTDGAVYLYESPEDDEPNAALFSDDALTLSGNGSLSVTANFNDGITSKDSLLITGNLTISVTAADDGIRGKDTLTIDGGDLTISAEGDGLKSDNTVTLNDGTVNIVRSYEGVEAEYITINGGDISLTASDDGFNATSQADTTATTQGTGRGGRGGGFGGEAAGAFTLTINGGFVVINAQGDGLDSNGSIVMTGGTVIVQGTTANNNGAIDYNGTFTISGGDLIAVGSAGMPQAPSNASTQHAVMVNFTSALPAATLITLRDSTGQALLSLTATKTFQSAVFSTPTLVEGETYDVLVNGDVYTTFTISQIITQLGQASGRMRP